MVLRLLPHPALLLIAALLAAVALALVACGGDDGGGNGEPTQAPQETQPSSTEPASDIDEDHPSVVAARQQMATSFDTDPAEVEVVSVEEATFSDSCLDVTPLAATPEVCAQVITPGYIITLRIGATVATYHADESGTNVRFAGVDVSGGGNEIEID
jgi:hypothetical protein